jgi:hypothetical protein
MLKLGRGFWTTPRLPNCIHPALRFLPFHFRQRHRFQLDIAYSRRNLDASIRHPSVSQGGLDFRYGQGFHFSTGRLMFGPPGSGESETPHRTARFPASTQSDSHDLTKGC